MERRDIIATPLQGGRDRVGQSGPEDPGLRGLFVGNCRAALLAVTGFSAIIGLLGLTGPLFMLQVYDRVLPARSEETLVALVVLAAFLFMLLGLFDLARSRAMARTGHFVQQALDDRLFPRMLGLPSGRSDQRPATLIHDVDTLRQFLAGPLAISLADLPWTPLFYLALFLLHPLLGGLAAGGTALLLVGAIARQRRLAGPARTAAAAEGAADRMAHEFLAHPDEVRAFALPRKARQAWLGRRAVAGASGLEVADTLQGTAVLLRTVRLAMQSAILALAAWLCLRGALSFGALSAASILLGRALQPVEGLVSGWPLLTRAAGAWARIGAALTAAPLAGDPPAFDLPAPTGRLAARSVRLSPFATPGKARQNPPAGAISFQVDPGQILGIIGPSGSGKTTLIRSLAGLSPPAGGEVRLDGAPMHHYRAGTRAAAIGYLPQTPRFFSGTIAENIARFADDASPETVIKVARQAGAHDMILGLADGYGTRLCPDAAPLSGGQAQRIALARALYGAPSLLILDEPDARLDADGALALDRVLRSHRASGGTVILSAHRQSLIRACDLLLALQDGGSRAFGPRQAVLSDLHLAFRRPDEADGSHQASAWSRPDPQAEVAA